MSFFDNLISWFGGSIFDSEGCDFASQSSAEDGCSINPANGLPMIGGYGGVDVEGNTWGTDVQHDSIESSSGNDMFNATWHSSPFE